MCHWKRRTNSKRLLIKSSYSRTIIEIMKQLTMFMLRMFKHKLENYDKAIKNSPNRKAKWNIVRTDKKELITSLGTICYEKTLYINPESGERAYLLDRELGFSKHQRMTESAEAQLLEEAVQTSYQKGGKAASALDDVSKETVMDKIRHLDFNKAYYSDDKSLLK